MPRRKSTSQHDALFKQTFERPDRAAVLFRKHLPAKLSEQLVWDTLRRVPGSFVSRKLAKLHTDLLFSVRMGDSEVLLYLLLEHQSTVARDMPFRMLEYMVEIWKHYRKQSKRKSKSLPVIIPMIVSHAHDGWTGTLDFWSMLEPNPALVPELGPFVPNFEVLLEDLAHLGNQAGRGFSRVYAERRQRTA